MMMNIKLASGGALSDSANAMTGWPVKSRLMVELIAGPLKQRPVPIRKSTAYIQKMCVTRTVGP